MNATCSELKLTRATLRCHPSVSSLPQREIARRQRREASMRLRGVLLARAASAHQLQVIKASRYLQTAVRAAARRKCYIQEAEAAALRRAASRKGDRMGWLLRRGLATVRRGDTACALASRTENPWLRWTIAETSTGRGVAAGHI